MARKSIADLDRYAKLLADIISYKEYSCISNVFTVGEVDNFNISSIISEIRELSSILDIVRYESEVLKLSNSIKYQDSEISIYQALQMSSRYSHEIEFFRKLSQSIIDSKSSEIRFRYQNIGQDVISNRIIEITKELYSINEKISKANETISTELDMDALIPRSFLDEYKSYDEEYDLEEVKPEVIEVTGVDEADMSSLS